MKKALRTFLLKKRDRISPAEKKTKEASIRKRLFSLGDFKRAGKILFYASFRTEVDTIQCMGHALRTGKEVSLPLVDAKERELRLYRIKDVSELASGYMGIPEPRILRGREVRLEDMDLVIIPGSGFDVHGNRLGYGAGYYDRLLSGAGPRPPTLALAFEEQMTERIPSEAYDVRVDMIATDKRLIRCSRSGVTSR